MNKEELLAKWSEPIKVLDHGHVRLIDTMGDDERIEAAARLSYQKGTRKVSETKGLLRFLMRHKHWTPFEKCVVEIDMKMPIVIARQFVRHRTQSINELSGRYSELPAEFYVPETDQICHQDKKNKQGRAEAYEAPYAEMFQRDMIVEGQHLFSGYQEKLSAGMARETARNNLPLSTYTQWNTTMNLRNLFGFLSLRLDPHAQWEAQQFAVVIAHMVKDWVPIAYEAFEDYDLHAVSFSRLEMAALKLLVDFNLLMGADFETSVMEGAGLFGRERDEFVKKIEALGG